MVEVAEPPSQTLWQSLEVAASASPSKDLLVVDDARFSYREVLERAQGLAASLVREGVGPRDVVALWLHNSLEWVVSLFAVARIGALSVGINTRFRDDEVAYVLEHSQAKALIVTHLPGGIDFVDLTYRLLPGLRDGAPRPPAPRFPRLRTVICTATTTRPGMLAWPEMAVPLAGVCPVDHLPTPEDPAHIQYTSGSTARPKGAVLTHAGMTRNARTFGDRMGLTDEDRFFSGNPSFHVAAVVTALLNVVTHRASYVTMQYYEAGAALALMEREECTARNGMDTMFQREMSHPDFPHRRLLLRKGAMMGAGSVLRTVAERFGMHDVVSIYSLSEASGNATSTRPADPLEVRVTTVGRPLPGVEVRLVESVTGAASAPGEPGEILLRGWNIMRGYYREPAETAKAIDGDGWLHTGDLGRWGASGNLIFAGRLKDIVRVGGENVSALEVEDFLMSHPAVKIAQVVPTPDPDLGQVPVAFVELKPDIACSLDQLLAFFHGRLARYKVPRAIGFVSDWPVTGSGKIRKADLVQDAAALYRKTGR